MEEEKQEEEKIMRELKLKAWDKVNKKWFDGYDNIEYLFSQDSCDGRMETEKFIYVEYIGRKDKNGKEIYEGNLVELLATTDTPGSKYIKRLGKVIWNDLGMGGFCVVVKIKNKNVFAHPQKCSLIDIEVVGDIYKNPELCKK